MTAPLIWVCNHVFQKERTVALIAHHSDGQWQLTCGKNDHSLNDGGLKSVHIDHIVEDDDLARAMIATRKGFFSEMRSGNWIEEEISED